LQGAGCHIDDIPLEVDVTPPPQEGKQCHIHRHRKVVDGTSSSIGWTDVVAGAAAFQAFDRQFVAYMVIYFSLPIGAASS